MAGSWGRAARGSSPSRTSRATTTWSTPRTSSGSHELKAGFGFQRIDADVLRDTSGGQIVEILDPLEDDPLAADRLHAHVLREPGRDPRRSLDRARHRDAAERRDRAAFIQDRWQILSNLTVNAGVRWEKQLIKGLDNITFIDVDHFSPRVGFTWDFLNNGRTKAYASYSQFVPLIPMDMNVRSLNGERDGFTTNFDPVELTCDSEFFGEEDCVIRGTAVDDIDPNLESPYSEEILAGVEWQVSNTSVVGLRGIYRALGRVLEDTYISDLDNYAFFNPGDSALAPEFAPGKRYFRGIELSGQKRLSDCWMMYASYMYSSLKGNFDGSFRAIGGFFARNPFITDDFDYPEFQVNAYGRLTLDRPHQAKMQVAYTSPFGLTMSASGYYQSGTPLSRIGWWDAYIGPEIFITERGSEGRSPDNYEIDLQADYGLQLGPVTVHFLASLFNVLEPAAGPAGRPGLGTSAGQQRAARSDERNLRPGQPVAAAANAAAGPAGRASSGRRRGPRWRAATSAARARDGLAEADLLRPPDSTIE